MSITAISRLTALAFAVAATAVANDKPEAKSPHVVKTQELRIDLTWQATLVPESAQVVAIDADAWNSWLLEEAAVHGAAVKTGDVVLRLRDVELDRKIVQLERDLRKAEITLAKTERAAEVVEAAASEALADSELAKARAAEAWADYQAIDQALDREGAGLQVKTAQDRLAYEQEELAELEKMYRADDLHDATEEIVLQRQRNTVRSYDFAARSAARGFRNYDLREERKRAWVERSAAVAARDFALATDLAPLNKEERLIALAEQRQTVADLTKSLADHRRDRDRLVHKATMDGIVYRGAFTDGKFVPGSEKLFRWHAKQPVKTPILTIVDNANLTAAGTVAGKDVGHLRPGTKVALELPSAPGTPLVGSVAAVAKVPATPGQFPVTVKPATLPEVAVAGAAATVYATPVFRPDVIMLPANLVHRHPTAIGNRQVYVKDGDAVAARTVTTGLVVDGKIEIHDGLKVGDQVVPGPSTK